MHEIKYEIIITVSNGDKFISRDVVKGQSLLQVVSQLSLVLLQIRDKEIEEFKVRYHGIHDDDIPF